MTEPHPLRCLKNLGEYPIRISPLCNFFWYDSFELIAGHGREIGCTCTGEIKSLSMYEMNQTNKRGCASHSNATSAEKVLDELDKYMENMFCFAFECQCPIEKKLKELRQEREQ